MLKTFGSFLGKSAAVAALGLGLAFIGLPFAVNPAASQPAPTITQQSGTQLNAGLQCQTISGAAVATQNTLTFVVPSGFRFYLTSVYLAASQNATASANTNQAFTSTNLNGIRWEYSAPATVNGNTTVANYANPAGIAVSSVGPLSATIVSPAAITNTAFPMNACGYFAP